MALDQRQHQKPGLDLTEMASIVVIWLGLSVIAYFVFYST